MGKTMVNKCIILVFVAALCLINATPQVETLRSTVKELFSAVSFGKLNDYLERKVNSDDLMANVQMAKKKIRSSMILLDQPLKEALGMLIQLPATISNMTSCGASSSARLLEKCDEKLAGDETHSSIKNYPMGRVDRILESVAYENVRMCRLGVREAQPQMKVTFKQLAYDQINIDLVNRVADKDPETNMEAASEILQSLEDREGSYARALEQFLFLRSIVTDDSCNEMGLQIVMKNDLATRGLAHVWQVFDQRRIIGLVNHYFKMHATTCHPIYVENILASLNQLDLRSYKRVLALVSVHYLLLKRTDEVVRQAESKQQVDQDFTIPLLEQIAKRVRVSECTLEEVYREFRHTVILRYLEAETKNDPRSKFLFGIVDVTTGERVVMKDKILELYNEYVREPCENLHNLIDLDMQQFDYNWQMVGNSFKQQELPLNFRLLTSAFHLCKRLLDQDNSKILV